MYATDANGVEQFAIELSADGKIMMAGVLGDLLAVQRVMIDALKQMQTVGSPAQHVPDAAFLARMELIGSNLERLAAFKEDI